MPATGMDAEHSPLKRVVNVSPSDIGLITRRVYDHVIERRMSPEETQELVKDCGYDSIEDFCAAIGMPMHVARRWARFGISGEMNLVLRQMRDSQRRMAEAIRDFKSMTHVEVDDFLRERGVLSDDI